MTPRPGARPLGRAVGRGCFAVLYAARATGCSNVPAAGPVVIAANHTGFLDGALVISMAPRPSHFLVLQRNFEGFIGRLLHWTVRSRSTRAAATARPWGRRSRCSAAVTSSASSRRAGGAGATSPPPARGWPGWPCSPAPPWCPRPAWAPGAPVTSRRRGHGCGPAWSSTSGAPVALDLPDGLPGRGRLELATEQIRTALEAHVQAAARAHGIPLPTDVPPDLLD